jgi:SNF2 family DNA or RNA helicase
LAFEPLDFPYQAEGAGFLALSERVGLFDEPGLGKTAQAIMALDFIKAKRVIVVAPAAVREVWLGEFKKFATQKRRVARGKDIDDLARFTRGKIDVLIVSYEMAAKWSKTLEGDFYDVIIFDESHYLKSHDANRTKRMLGARCDGMGGLARWAARVWFLTGTPVPNDPLDCWPFLRFSRATGLGITQFKQRYFRQAGMRLAPRKELLPEIRHALNSVSIRRTKQGVGLQLPPIWLTTQMVDGQTDEIRRIIAGHPGLSDAILAAVQKGGLDFIEAGHIATLRRLVGEAKAPAFAKMLIEELHSHDEKVVVFGIHRAALNIVRTALDSGGFGVVGIDGETSEAARRSAIRDFQADGGPRVFVGNIRAAGTGITLTAAADLIMLESSWAPADNAQAIMRVHRIGQERQVRARFITLAHSIDEQVNAAIVRKTAVIAQIGLADGLTPPPTSA